VLAVLGAVVATAVACTEQVTVGPEGQFSWEPRSQLVWPVRGSVVSAYGDAARPGHRGIDLVAKPGEAVAGAKLGKVAFAGEIAGYGRTVVLSHADRLSTVYAHLGTMRVTEGDTVAQGQTIGTISSEGYLHFETRESAQPVDPAKFYPVAPEPGAGVSVDVRKKVADEPSSVGTFGVLGVEAPPPTTPTAAAVIREIPRPTPTPVLAPTLTPRNTPRPAPTATPTLVPTAEPTPTLAPTPRPTPTPRLVPTVRPRAAATPEPTFRPERTPRAADARPPAPIEATRPVPTEEPAAASDATSSGDRWGRVGMGAALLGANLLYVPAKLVYSGIGAFTGTIALVLAHDTDVANSIWVPTMRGDYVVTEQHLRGELPLQFLGNPTE
jgi:hypothetical protein